jgi:signal transduction histidine kinase
MLSVVALAIICLANILLAASVLLNNSKSALNRAYAAMAVTLPIWSIVVFLEDTGLGHSSIQTLAKFDYGLSVILVGLFYWFCREITGFRKPFIDIGVLVFASLNVGLIWADRTLHVAFEGGNVVFNPKLGFAAFILYLVILLVVGLVLLTRSLFGSSGKLRGQLKFVGLGLFLTIISILIADIFVPRVFGISSPDVTRAGLYSTIFFTGFCWYAIVRHRFMDLRFVVARSVAYVLLLTSLATIYGVAIYLTSLLFFHDSSNTFGQGITYTILSVVLAFTFQPLRFFFEKVTDKIFYRDRYDSQEVINSFSQILVSELRIERILNKSLTALCESLHIEFGQIIVFNNDRVYRIEHFGPLPKRLMVAPELRTLNRSMLIADELESGERKHLLERHGIRVSMMLSTHEEFIGYLLLGDKLSGDIYSNQDIEVLEIITKELAVAILNAKAYTEIQAFNLSLQARIDHATNRLRVANRHLKELDRAKDEFISMASHQLRTPLTTIKGYLSMMLEGDVGSMKPQQKEFVGYAFTSSERMVNLISDLLNVSRLQAGRFLIQTKPTDMVQLIDDEVRQLQTHATAKGLKLIFDRPTKPLPPAEIDDGKTRQVIMNFIDNAIYYTQKGEVRVVLQQTGDHVRLEVRDTGIGVPPEARKKLFSKFFRAENAQTVRPDGTGLGLYLAKRVIEDQDGTIIFSSVEGKGSTFGFELPFKPEPIKHEDKKKKHGRQLITK